MKIRIRLIGLVVVALVGLLTACGGDITPQDNASTNTKSCENDRDICTAMAEEQITISVHFPTSFGDVTNAKGDLVGSFSEGDPVRVVCFIQTDGAWPMYGVLMEDVATDQPDNPGGFEEPDRFTTGMVNGENLSAVGFISAKYLGGEKHLESKLRPQLEERFEDLAWNSCEDSRVLLRDTGQSIIVAQSAM